MSQNLVFDQFEIRGAERAVLVGGQAMAIGSRAFDVLLALAERVDRVVSKAELMDIVWPGTVVEENNLTVQISALRRALGHASILTVTGRGYRLAARQAAAPGPAPASDAQATAHRLQRRLAAIAQAEVVGWARMVARDAQRAAEAWKQIRVNLVESSVAQHGGRLIELTAERIQLEFASAVDAVQWSLHLQAALAERRQAATSGHEPGVHMRIGIAVDDFIVDDGKLVGDGVNMAADLQYSAGHDEVLTTQKVCGFVAHRIGVHVEPLGERLMRRLQRPSQVFRIRAADRPSGLEAARPAPAHRLASVAVLPFASGDAAGQSYFGDGVTEEIIATLSLNRALFVIAHGSTVRYRQFPGDLTEVGRELGVRYLVTGSVRREAERVRIQVSLLAAADQRVLWQRRYDGITDDLFGFQSQIAANVAGEIAPKVQDLEVERVRRRPTSSYGAYDCVLRGLAGMYQLGTPEFQTSGDMFKRAIALDPDYAQAHAHLAWWYSLQQFERRGAADEGDAGRLALAHAMQAVRLDGEDAWALSVAGYMLALQQKRLESALEMFEQAITINPSCAAAWARSAATLSYMGRADESMARVQRAMRLSPFDQHHFWHLTICGGASFVGGHYADAAGWLAKALRLNPRFNGARRMLIAALMCTGELAEARGLAQGLLEDCPDFSVAEFGRLSPMREPHLSTLLQGLRHAGLPD